MALQPTSLSAPASQPGTDAGFSALRLVSSNSEGQLEAPTAAEAADSFVF